MFLILLFKLLTQFPFVSFLSGYLYPLSAPFLNPLSSPSPPSLLSQFFVLLRLRLQFITFCSPMDIFLHSVSHHDILIMHSISLKKPNFDA